MSVRLVPEPEQIVTDWGMIVTVNDEQSVAVKLLTAGVDVPPALSATAVTRLGPAGKADGVVMLLTLLAGRITSPPDVAVPKMGGFVLATVLPSPKPVMATGLAHTEIEVVFDTLKEFAFSAVTLWRLFPAARAVSEPV